MTMNRIGWGFECWQFGNTELDVTVGNGADILVHRIIGAVSASSAGVVVDPNYIRQTLVTLTYTAPWASYAGLAGAAPNARSINEVNGNLASVNVKQRGNEVVHIPVDFDHRDCPQRCAGGLLRALVDNQTYGSTPITSPATECLDVECHFFVFWTYA